jgi:epoxyqueuosine reductase QueG
MHTIDPHQLLRELYDADTDKFFDEPSGVAMFDPPLVGVATADDPWFTRFKEVIGEFYWTPDEALATSATGKRARSVISWCLPICQAAREANREETRQPARLWAYVRTFGEAFNSRLRAAVAERLQAQGYAALAPHGSPDFTVNERPNVGIASCWSERHTAFVAGLGTFGISGGLITEHGIAHRLGSVVTDADIPATARPYGDDPFAWCLKLAEGTCGACIGRCPADSIGETTEARDKKACGQYAYHHITKLGREVFGWEGVYGCGLCQTDVPCESRNPCGVRRET